MMLLNFALFSTLTVINGYEITILHTNDVHARFEQFNKYGSACKEDEAREGKCFGGVARRRTKIQEIRGSHDNVLLLDAGDQFTGTTWFNVYQGNASAFFMNQLGYDVMCLGNHEFDKGVKGLRTFLDKVDFPVLSSNLDATNEPLLLMKFLKSWKTNIGGGTVGIVGYITPETEFISNPGPTVHFNNIITSVQSEVLKLQEQGVNKIIALGHAGFSMDKEVAQIDGVDLVVGGRTNTFLYTGDKPSDEEIEGPYPFVVAQAGGGQALVVQDFIFGKYLGYLKLTFDSSGVVTNFSGNPILLDSNVKEDPVIAGYVNEWKISVTALGAEHIGYSNVFLDGEREHCRLQECNLGNLITDAIIDYHLNFSHPVSQWAPAAVALWNGGGIRSSVGKGVVIADNAFSVLQFGNEIDMVTVSGKNIRDQLEHSVRDLNRKNPSGGFLQMSGLRVVYNLRNLPGERVVSAEIRCLECDVPSYSPLRHFKNYNIFVSNFLLNGGDGYSFKPSKYQRFNTLDVTILISYFKKHSPVYTELEGRIQFHTDQISSGSSKSSSLTYFLFMDFLFFIHKLIFLF